MSESAYNHGFAMEPGRKVFFVILGIIAVLFVGLVPAAPAGAGEISILTPLTSAGKDLEVLSRNRVINAVVKVSDRRDIELLVMKSLGEGTIINASGRFEKGDAYFVHYQLPLKRGKNVFSLAPGGGSIEVRYIPLRSLLNIDLSHPDLYLFHRNENIPAVCQGCHTRTLPAGAKVDKARYGQFSPECYSCHSGIATGSEWRHFPSSGLLCRTCHQADPAKDKLNIPTGKVEDLCFECHINLRKWNDLAHIHGPVGTGDCTICHDPHGSNSRYQLWTDGKAKLCVVCHEDKKKFVDLNQKGLYIHGILNAKGCVACHDPHASGNRFQLYDEVNELCVSCHLGFKGLKTGHPVQRHPLKDIKDPLRSGRLISCTSCHNPHGSDYRYLLIGDHRGGRICIKCHDR